MKTAHPVEKLMTEKVERVGSQNSVRDASRRLRQKDLGILVVTDEGQRPVGVVTDRDIVTRSVARGLDPARTTVREIMTPDPVCCRTDDRVVDAAGLMATHRIRRIPVLDQNDERVVGLVSLGDIAVGRGSPEMTSAVLSRVCAPRGEAGRKVEKGERHVS